MPDATISLTTRADLSALVAARNSFNVLSSEEQKAERAALSLAQSMARLDGALGQPAQGAARLRAALQNATSIDDRQGVAALNQIVRLEEKVKIEADRAAAALERLARIKPPPPPPPPQNKGALDSLSGSAGQVALGFLSIQAAERGLDFIKTGAEAHDVRTSFDNLTKAAGTTGDALLGSLRAASNGTIADASLIKSANLGLLLTENRIAKDLPQLTTIAQASAKATGQSVDFVFESLVKGISRGSAKIIDNAGITLDGQKAYDDYAKSIGKTADQLNKGEQQQAVLNAVISAGNDIVKQAGINANDASVKIAQAETAAKNLLTALSAKVAPVAGSIAGGITSLITTGGVAPGAVDAGNAVNAKLVGKGQDYQAYADSVKAANNQLQTSIGGVAGFYAKLRLGLDTLTPGQFAYAQSLIATGVASDVALQKAQALPGVVSAYAEALRNSTDTATAHRAELTALAPKLFEVANQSDHNKTAVEELLNAYAGGRESVPGLIEALNALSQANDTQRQAAFEEERENRRLGVSFGGSASAFQQAIAATNAQIDQSAAATAGDIDTKQALAAATDLVREKTVVAGDAFLALNPNISAAGVASAVAAGKISASVGTYIEMTLRIQAARGELARLQVQAGVAAAKAPVGGGVQGGQDRALAAEGRGLQNADDVRAATAKRAADEKERLARKSARAEGVLQNGTHEQKLAQLRKQYDEAVRFSGAGSAAAIRAQNDIDRENASKHKSARGGKGLDALDRVDIQLAGDYQAQLDAVNKKLAAGHLTELQRKQLLKERLDLEKKIGDEQTKQNNASLDARIQAVENRKKDREDAKRLSAAQAVLANPNNFSAEQRVNAQDLVELLPLEQQKRNNEVAAKAREAGIAIPGGAGTTAKSNPFTPGAAQAQPGAPQAPAQAQAAGTPLIINMDGKQVAIVQLPFIVEGLKSYTTQTRAAGG